MGMPGLWQSLSSKWGACKGMPSSGEWCARAINASARRAVWRPFGQVRLGGSLSLTCYHPA
jgi:hypothetical protein